MPRISVPLYKRLYEDVRVKILHGEYKKNSKLESVRSLANRLGISTTTVEKAYNQLLVEGYVTSVPRSGFIVESVTINTKRPRKGLVEPIEHINYENTKLTEDMFDMKVYKSILNKVLNYDASKLYQECDPRGEFELREEIRKYVLKERNITCDVNQIVVGTGSQSLLMMLHSVHPGKSISYLAPGYKTAMTVFQSQNYFLKPRTSITELCRLKSDYLFISPSNTYPTGDIIKIKDRSRIIKWAKEQESYIIEDDYNFFIRYNSYSVPSIYSYNNGENVIYMGTFSKIIIPSIKISFMILPIPLYKEYSKVYNNISQGVSKLDQLTLALFMKEGLFQRHIKKLYNKYKEKNEAIVKALNNQHKRKEFKVSGTDSNLHIVIDFKRKTDLKAFTRNCRRYDLYISQITGTNKVIFPYSGIELKHIPRLIKDLFYSI